MTNTAVRVENLSKHYRLGELGRPDSFREAFSDATRSIFKRFASPADPSKQKVSKDFWALKDINFEIKQGEVVGIIGHNGAGKSTLLKILSRITDPTTGKADIWGRVGSLLEVGTGFHPELTGKENIYLNGAILGMTPLEIKSKFDEIVAFAEIENFLSTPVKRYSSGMYVRLAFAVAAHLQPEVLIVDEVLAVGDVKFQNKCLGKMKDVASQGRTVLFVSHNMAAVQTMCTRGIVLHKGEVYKDCSAAESVYTYLQLMEENITSDLMDRKDRRGIGEIKVTSIQVTGEGDKPVNTLSTGEKVRFELTIDHPRTDLICIISLVDQHGTPVVAFRNLPNGDNDKIDVTLNNRIICEVENFPVATGQYSIDYELWSPRSLQDSILMAGKVNVIPGVVQGRLVRHLIRRACVVPPHQWTLPA